MNLFFVLSLRVSGSRNKHRKKFKKDNFPISIFKNGVIAFPIVNENLKNFQLFGEALDGIDGKVIEMNLDDKF